MASRSYKIGSIVKRTNDLMKSGVIEKRPLWLDIVETLPPLTQFQHNECAQAGKPPFIRYSKDVLIKNFMNSYKLLESRVSLFEDHPHQLNTAEKFTQLQLVQLDGKEAIRENIQSTFDKTKDIFEQEHKCKLNRKSE